MGAYKEVPWVAGEELLECPAVPALCAPSASAFLLMLKDTFGPVGQLYDTYFRKGPFTFIWEYGIGCVICMVSQLSHYFLLKLFTNIPIRAALESTDSVKSYLYSALNLEALHFHFARDLVNVHVTTVDVFIFFSLFKPLFYCCKCLQSAILFWAGLE